MTGPLLFGAFATGFLGSGHCLGMCGSLVAALSLSGSRRAGLPFHLLYNAGRIGTYALLGCLAGWLGVAALRAGSLHAAGRYLTLAADAFVILAGVGTAAGLGRLSVMALEFPAPVRALSGVVQAFRRLPSPLAALPLGAAMGFLPCGFLYAMLLTAGLGGTPLEATGIMVAFGLGTAPALLAFGGAAHLLSARARGWMLRGAGLVVALMGAYNLGRHLCVPSCH